jgi:hypothetical protein
MHFKGWNSRNVEHIRITMIYIIIYKYIYMKKNSLLSAAYDNMRCDQSKSIFLYDLYLIGKSVVRQENRVSCKRAYKKIFRYILYICVYGPFVEIRFFGEAENKRFIRTGFHLNVTSLAYCSQNEANIFRT